MKRKQLGISFMGICFMAIIFAFLILMGLRLFPLYNEKFVVITTMNNIASRENAENLSVAEVRKILLKNMEIANSRLFDSRSVKELVHLVVDKKAKKKYLHVTYEARNILVKDINLLLIFDRKVELGKPPQ